MQSDVVVIRIQSDIYRMQSDVVIRMQSTSLSYVVAIGLVSLSYVYSLPSLSYVYSLTSLSYVHSLALLP